MATQKEEDNILNKLAEKRDTVKAKLISSKKAWGIHPPLEIKNPSAILVRKDL